MTVFRPFEEVPVRASLELDSLAIQLGCLPPCYIPILPIEHAARDRCVLNVQGAIKAWGGKPRFGWKLFEAAGLWVTARYHAVRETEGGLLVDETPHECVDARSYCLFALDEHAGAKTFENHQPTVRNSIFRPDSRNKTRPTYVDPLASAVQGMIDALNAVDGLFVLDQGGQFCTSPHRLSEAYNLVQRNHRRLLRLLEDRSC